MTTAATDRADRPAAATARPRGAIDTFDQFVDRVVARTRRIRQGPGPETTSAL